MLTDITVSVKKLTKEDVGDKFNVPGAYVHRVKTLSYGHKLPCVYYIDLHIGHLQGMYRTAKGIRDQLLSPDKPILTNTLGDYEKDVRTLRIMNTSQ